MAVNLLLNLMASKGNSAFDREEKAEGTRRRRPTSTAANMVTAKLGKVMNLISRLPAADKASRGAFAAGRHRRLQLRLRALPRRPQALPRPGHRRQRIDAGRPARHLAPGRERCRTSSATSAGPGGTTSARPASASGRTGRMPVGSTSRSRRCSPAPVRSTSPACRARRRSSPRRCGGSSSAPAIAVRPLDHAG